MFTVVRQISEEGISPKSLELESKPSLERKKKHLKVASVVFLCLGILSIGTGITLYAAGHSLLFQTTRMSLLGGSVAMAVGLASFGASIYSLVSFKDLKKLGPLLDKSYEFYQIGRNWWNARLKIRQEINSKQEELDKIHDDHELVEFVRGICKEVFEKVTKKSTYIGGYTSDEVRKQFRKQIDFFFEIKIEKIINELIEKNPSLFGSDANYTRDSNWFYLPYWGKNAKLEQTFQDDLKKDFNSIVSNLEYEEINDKRKDYYKSLVQKNLAKEYKIHLMPKGPFAYGTLAKLLEFASQDSHLKDTIKQIKIARSSVSVKDENEKDAPVIVVYFEGKETAQTALNLLVKYFKPYFGWGSNICPRYNVKGKNPLIYYAQGDSTQKAKLKTESFKIFQMLYESDGTHYKTDLGGSRLSHPSAF